MKKIICLLIILIWNPLNAQTFTVLDSITNEPLAYSAVFNGDSGFYSDENGQFTITNFNEIYIIKYLGYHDYILNLPRLNDSILLQPHISIMNPVILYTKTKNRKLSFSSTPKSFAFLPLSYGNEIITKLIPSQKNTNLFIESISLSFIENKALKKSDTSTAVIRINIYSEMEKVIFSSDPISLNLAENQNIDLDLSIKQFQFDKNGIVIGIEVIKIESENPIGISSVNPGLTSASNKEYTQNSFFKYTFQNNQHIIPLEEFFEKGYTRKKIVRNLNVSLILAR